jgi:hypothetical protein
MPDLARVAGRGCGNHAVDGEARRDPGADLQ